MTPHPYGKFLDLPLKYITKQESIPVGCVPPVCHIPLSLRRGGLVFQRRVVLSGGWIVLPDGSISGGIPYPPKGHGTRDTLLPRVRTWDQRYSTYPSLDWQTPARTLQPGVSCACYKFHTSWLYHIELSGKNGAVNCFSFFDLICCYSGRISLSFLWFREQLNQHSVSCFCFINIIWLIETRSNDSDWTIQHLKSLFPFSRRAIYFTEFCHMWHVVPKLTVQKVTSYKEWHVGWVIIRDMLTEPHVGWVIMGLLFQHLVQLVNIMRALALSIKIATFLSIFVQLVTTIY